VLPRPRPGFTPPRCSLLSLFSFTRSDLAAAGVEDDKSDSGAEEEEEKEEVASEEEVNEGVAVLVGVSTTEDVVDEVDDCVGVAVVVVVSAFGDLSSLGALGRFLVGSASSRA